MLDLFVTWDAYDQHIIGAKSCGLRWIKPCWSSGLTFVFRIFMLGIAPSLKSRQENASFILRKGSRAPWTTSVPKVNFSESNNKSKVIIFLKNTILVTL